MCRLPPYDLLTCTLMFSSLVALLPSALHINAAADLPKQTVDPEESDKEDKENAYGAQTIQPQALSDQDQRSPTKGKEKDAKSPSEVCCFFRSYPSQSGSMNTGIVLSESKFAEYFDSRRIDHALLAIESLSTKKNMLIKSFYF